MSSIVVDLLDTAMPSLERLNTLLELADQAPRELLDGLRNSLQNVELELLQMDLLSDLPGADVRAERASVPGRSVRSKKEGPPSTNRGVRIPPSNSLKPRTGAASKAVGKGSKK